MYIGVARLFSIIEYFVISKLNTIIKRLFEKKNLQNYPILVMIGLCRENILIRQIRVV